MAIESIHVVVRIQAHPDSIKELKKALAELVEPSLVETGCRRYEVWQNSDVPAVFAVVEEWASDAAYDAHMQSPHIAEVLSSAGHALLGEVDIQRYRLVK